MAADVDEPGRGDLDLPGVLAALADRARLVSVRTLAVTGEASCTTIVELTGIGVTKSTMSHHLRVLREAGITHTRVSGSRRLVSLRRDDLEARFPGLLDAVLSVALAVAAAGDDGGCPADDDLALPADGDCVSPAPADRASPADRGRPAPGRR